MKPLYTRLQEARKRLEIPWVEKTWDQWLGPLVPGLPSFQIVIGELRPQIAVLIPSVR